MSREILSGILKLSKKDLNKCLEQTAKKEKVSEDTVINVMLDFYSFNLPMEIIELIAFNLPMKDLINLCKTSKLFSEICKDQVFWKRLLRRDYPYIK